MEGLSADGPAAAAGAPRETATSAPSPYTRADLYDLLFRDYTADLDFYLGIAKAARGPVLDVGCGTGRVLLRALEAGLDIVGLEDSAGMLARLRENAAARGLAPRVTRGDMRAFRLPRRYACVMIPFDAFAHMLAAHDQIAALHCCREHLGPGGRLVFDVFSATPAMLATPITEPVLELETRHPETGLPVRLYDGRRLDVATQTQHSRIAIEELDASGRVARVHRFDTVVRWIYPSEMELLLRLAGFARWEITGGFDGRPAADHEGAIVVSAWVGA
ncbi:MAG: class I SAM-dependent methyltransferase [Candidatus Eiseniibacteriota bacterium]